MIKEKAETGQSMETLAQRLAAIMKVLVEHRDQKSAVAKETKGADRCGIVTAGDVFDEWKRQQEFSAEEWLRHDIAEMLEDPIEHLLRQKTRRIGETAYELGEYKAMMAVHNRAYAILEERGDERSAAHASRFVDVQWDGIGNCWWS